MCTTKQLITFLQTFPEDTEVEVLEEYSRAWDTSTRWVSLDVGGGILTLIGKISQHYI